MRSVSPKKFSSPTSINPQPRSYILFTYLSLFIFGLIDNSRGPIYPKVIDVFGLSNASSSWIFTLTSVVSFALTMAVPFWLSGIGAIKATKAAMGFHFLALMCMGLSSLLGQGFWVFLAGSAFLGLATGIQNVTMNLIISKVSTPYNGSRLFSGLHSMYGAASLIAPLLMGAVFRFGFAWEWVVMGMALIPLVHLITFRSLSPLDLATAGKAQDSTKLKRIFALGIIFSFYVACELLISSRLVVYLYEEGSIKLDTASYCLTIFFILLLGGRLIFSFANPPFKGLTMLRLSCVSTLAVLLAALLWNPLILPLAGATGSYFFPVGMNFVKEIHKENSEAVIARVMMFVGAMVALMHFGFGLASDVFGIGAAMWIAPGLTAAVLILLLLQRD